MIITKTPLRITFAGGGSDMASYYTKHPACCISATINKYVYVLVKKRFDKKIYLKYSDNEVVDVSSVDDIEHDFIRETLKFMNIDYGVEIINWADIPTKGTGLGSSSSFLVGLLLALHTLEGRHVSKEALASQSCYIEIDRCKKPIGVQDQYAAAYGGFNQMRFGTDVNRGDFKEVKGFGFCDQDLRNLSDHMALFYTGVTRESKEILIITSVIAVILFCIFLIIKNQKLCLNTMSKIPRKWILKEIPDNTSSFYDSLLILFKGKTVFSGLSIGIIAWLADAVAIYFCFLAFDLNFDFIYTTLTNFAPMIVGTILFIPGGLGVLELGMTGLLLQSGIMISTASALVLFIRFMITWSTVIAGIFALKLAKFN